MKCQGAEPPQRYKKASSTRLSTTRNSGGVKHKLLASLDLHVGNRKSSRGDFLFSTWRQNISSEVSFDSSEVLFLVHVENFYSSRGDFRFPT